MSLYDFDIIQGESKCITLIIKDSDGNPLNLSSYNVIRGGAKIGFSNNSYVLNLYPSLVLPSGVSINLSGYMTSGVPCSIFPYDVELATTGISGDNQVFKALRGYISVYPEVSY